MSVSSGLNIRSIDGSADIEQLRQQNRMLYEENMNLKKSLEDLIQINTELTESIEEFNNEHLESFPNINQEEIEQMAYKVTMLEQDLQAERSVNHNQNADQNALAEILKVVEELTTAIGNIEKEYREDIGQLTHQLALEKDKACQLFERMEQKWKNNIEKYEGLFAQLRRKDTIIDSLKREIEEKSKMYGMPSKKDLKVSTTIEELRTTLQKEIEKKNQVIKVYEGLLDKMKNKLAEKYELI